jgi:hypothetical protein
MPFPAISTLRPVPHIDFFGKYGHTRQEYIDGVLYPLPAHDRGDQRILENLLSALRPQLASSPCALFEGGVVGNGPPVASTPPGRHSYAIEGVFARPAVVIVLDSPAYFVPTTSVIMNPTVLIEVCSASEQDYYTGTRFTALRQWLSPAFSDYVLIATERPEVAHYKRQYAHDWPLELATDADDVIALSRVGCAVMLGELYRGMRDSVGRPFVRSAV